MTLFLSLSYARASGLMNTGKGNNSSTQVERLMYDYGSPPGAGEVILRVGGAL
jgi:hypothetical protein